MTTQHGSNLTGALDQQGGVTSIKFGPSAPEPGSLGAHRADPHKVVGGTLSFDAQGNQTGEAGFSRYNVHDARVEAEQAAAAGGSIAGTYDRANGGTVMIDGMRTNVATAVRLGLVDMVNGRPRDVSTGKASGPSISPQTITPPVAPNDDLKLAPEAAALPPAEHFKADEWQAYESDIEPIAQPAFDGAMTLGTIAAMDGTGLEAAATRLSREANMSPERATAMVASVEGMFKDVINRAVAADGIQAADLPDFYSYCRTQRNLQQAIAELTRQRKTALFRQYAAEFSARQARLAGVNG